MESNRRFVDEPRQKRSRKEGGRPVKRHISCNDELLPLNHARATCTHREIDLRPLRYRRSSTLSCSPGAVVAMPRAGLARSVTGGPFLNPNILHGGGGGGGGG
ncbi:unnamed protein product [Lampetra planeri]